MGMKPDCNSPVTFYLVTRKVKKLQTSYKMGWGYILGFSKSYKRVTMGRWQQILPKLKIQSYIFFFLLNIKEV